MISTIEPPLALIEEQKKTVFRDAVEPPQVAFGLVPKILNSIDVVLPIHEPIGVIGPHVMGVRNIQRTIEPESVRVYNAVR